MKFPLLFLILLLSTNCLKEQSPIQFFKEEVRMDINRSTVRVNGYYFFRNRTGQKKIVKLWYPFPVDSHHPYPDSVDVEGLEFTRTGDGVAFLLEFEPYETTQVSVAYKQSLFSNCARYILTTARRWGEPIREASFKVTAPKGYELDISYRPDSVRREDGRIVCYIMRKELLPEKELDVWWGKP